MISFLTPNITFEETDVHFTIPVNRSGFLDITNDLEVRLMSHNFSRQEFILVNETHFKKNQTLVYVSGIVANNSVYDGRRIARCCLTLINTTDTVRFIHQCMDITILDEDDCKLKHFLYSHYHILVSFI